MLRSEAVRREANTEDLSYTSPVLSAVKGNRHLQNINDMQNGIASIPTSNSCCFLPAEF